MHSPELSQEHHEKAEIPRLPALIFTIRDNEAEKPYQQQVAQALDGLTKIWRPNESSLLTSFENATGGAWSEKHRTQGIPVVLTATEGSKYKTEDGYLRLSCREVKSKWAKERGLMGTMRSTSSIQGSLVHELAHRFMTAEDEAFLLHQFSGRFPEGDTDLGQKGFFWEVYAELLVQASAPSVFSADEVGQWIDRQRLGHRGVYEFLDTISAEEKEMILRRDHPARRTMPDGAENPEPFRLADIRQRLRNLFSHH